MSLDSPKGVVANDRRVALRFSLIPKGNFVPAGHTLRLGPYEHGIDMSLRPRKTGSAASLAFGVHCSVFKKRFPDRRAKRSQSTWASLRSGHAPLLGDGPAKGRAPPPGLRVLVSKSRRSERPRGDPGMRGDWQDYRGRIAVSNRVASVNKRNRLRPRYIP